MSTEIIPNELEPKNVNVSVRPGGSDAVYGIGMIGAWVYYISRAKTFQEGLLGFFKGLVWPAILVGKLLELLEKE